MTMTDKLGTLSELAKANIKWIFVIIFLMLGMWLDSRYQTREDADVLQTKVELLETQLNLYINSATIANGHHLGELNTLSGRVTKKIKLIEDMHDDLNDLENQLIEHDVYIMSLQMEQK